MSTSDKKLWSPEEIDLLKRLLYERTPIPDIAVQLGRTEGAVRTRAQQLGISLMALRRFHES